MQGPATFNTFLEIFIFGGAGQGVFVYQPGPGAGNLIASITNSTHDAFGNVTHPGITSTIFNNLYVQMNAGRVTFGSDNPASFIHFPGTIGVSDALNNVTQPGTFLFSPSANSGGQAANISQVVLYGSDNLGAHAPRVLLFSGATGNAIPVAGTADVEVRGLLAISPSAAGNAFSVQIPGDTSPRFLMDTSGTHNWGPGNAVTDISLFRPAAGRLTIQASSSAGQVFDVVNLTSAPAGSNLSIINAAAGDSAFGVGVSGDTNARLNIDSNGKLLWSTGGSAADTTLFRGGVAAINVSGLLLATGSLQSETSVQIFQGAGTTNVFTIGALLAANNQFNIDGNGKMTWGLGGSTAVDTDLFRSGVNQLQTDGSIQAVGHFLAFATAIHSVAFETAVSGDPQARWTVDNTGITSWGTGSAGTDTTLYRVSAGNLGISAIALDVGGGAVEGWHSVAPSHAGMGGSINYRKMAQAGEIEVVLRTNAAASTVINNGDVIGTLPAGYRPATDNQPLSTTYSPFGVAVTSLQPLNVNTSGQIAWTGSSVTTPAGGTSFIYSIPCQMPVDL